MPVCWLCDNKPSGLWRDNSTVTGESRCGYGYFREPGCLELLSVLDRSEGTQAWCLVPYCIISPCAFFSHALGNVANTTWRIHPCIKPESIAYDRMSFYKTYVLQSHRDGTYSRQNNFNPGIAENTHVYRYHGVAHLSTRYPEGGETVMLRDAPAPAG